MKTFKEMCVRNRPAHIATIQVAIAVTDRSQEFNPHFEITTVRTDDLLRHYDGNRTLPAIRNLASHHGIKQFTSYVDIFDSDFDADKFVSGFKAEFEKHQSKAENKTVLKLVFVSSKCRFNPHWAICDALETEETVDALLDLFADDTGIWATYYNPDMFSNFDNLLEEYKKDFRDYYDEYTATHDCSAAGEYVVASCK